MVVVSSAVTSDNKEVKLAAQSKKTVLRRAEMLNILMKQHKKKIAVTRTHGKTTTTAMITTILESNQIDPTYLIGSKRIDNDHNANLGNSDYFVTESDESDGSFLCMSPNVGIVA